MLDFIVVGGGMIGAACALGLAKQGYRVVIIEKYMPEPFDAKQAPDVRMSALSLATERLLDRLGAWEFVQAMRSQPYDTLTVWESAVDEAQRTQFQANTINQTHLGHFVENRLTQLALHKALENSPNVTWYSDATITSLDPYAAQLSLSNGESLQARWVIGADGAQSQVRKLANIGQTGWQYAQHAMGVIVETDAPSTRETWQKFRPEGPIAYLPMYANYAALIWYDSAEVISHLIGLPDVEFQAQVNQQFAPFVGRFTALQRAEFPLTRSHSNDYVRGKTILVGDAAHTINPLAGQGVNIGFKDVDALLTMFEHSIEVDEKDIKSRYETPRRRQNALMMTAMDAFYIGFSNDLLPLKFVRNGLLQLANQAGPLKQRALEYAVGL
jgi:2-octaprenyl-3-methyl-6-methoxy-1,4-benzoquinol hydroxylase